MITRTATTRKQAAAIAAALEDALTADDIDYVMVKTLRASHTAIQATLALEQRAFTDELDTPPVPPPPAPVNGTLTGNQAGTDTVAALISPLGHQRLSVIVGLASLPDRATTLAQALAALNGCAQLRVVATSTGWLVAIGNIYQYKEYVLKPCSFYYDESLTKALTTMIDTGVAPANIGYRPSIWVRSPYAANNTPSPINGTLAIVGAHDYV